MSFTTAEGVLPDSYAMMMMPNKTELKQLSMAVTSRLTWLCAFVR